LVGWQKKGLIIKLKRGLYVLNERDTKFKLSRIFIETSEKVLDNFPPFPSE